MLGKTLVALAVLVAHAAHAQGMIRTYSLPTYSGSAPEEQDAVPTLKKGAPLVLWSLACEPSTAGTTFDNPTTSACVPARLNLPEEAYSPTGNGSARSFVKALERCMKVSVQKAPDDVIAAANRQDEDFIAQRIAKEKTATMTLVARVNYEEGRNFEVSMNTGGAALPLPVDQGAMTLYLVDAPKARAIDRALQAGDAKKALALAKAAVKSARKLDEKIRALGNLATAAAFAEDKSAAPAAPEELPEEPSDGAELALENMANLDAWRTTADFTFHAAGC